jgi:two-component sensor histidine kinase
MAQVYEHLLGSALNRTIDFGGYLSSLCLSFQDLQNVERPTVQLTCHSMPVMLDFDMVTALGLITSELIANSYAHAFPTGFGSIIVSLSSNQSGGDATIKCDDDGVGFVEAGVSNRHGLGFVRRLMQQIGGSVALRSDHGTRWTLRFPIPDDATVVAPCTLRQ